MAKALKLIAHQDLESQIGSLEDEGYAYFPGVIDADEVAELRAAMDRLEPAKEGYDRADVRDGLYYDKHILNCFNRDPLFLQYLDKTPVIEVAEAVMGHTDISRRTIPCHLIGMSTWVTGPGRPGQQLHIDWQPISLPEDVAADPRVKIPVFIATAHYYLDDLYEELGPTKFIPGSHRAGRPPGGDTQWKGMEEHSLMCKAGDVVMFRSEVWHRGSANTSSQTRYLLQVHYANRMITQKFPPYLNKFQFDQAILQQATPRQRRLLGDHGQAAYD